MKTIFTDVRYGLRSMLKQPSFTAIAVLTLALGVGANTALFSVVDAVLLKKLPVQDPERLVLFRASWNAKVFGPGSFDGSNYRDPATGLTVGTSFPLQTLTRLRQEHETLSDVFAFSPMEANFNAGGQAEVVTAQVVSGNYYSALGVPAMIGRTITEADDNAAASPVVVLSHRFWASRFNGDASVLGKQVNINNVAFTVAGVTPPGFGGAAQVGSSQDVSLPIAWEPQINPQSSNLEGAGTWWLRVMGRLKPGATMAQAEASLAAAFQQSVLEHRALRRTDAGAALRTLDPKDLPKLGVVGASRWRLVRQLLTESLLLAAVGGALGVLFALWIKNGLLIVTDWGGREISGLNPRLDLHVLGFTLGLSFLTGIIFGILPALRATNLSIARAQVRIGHLDFSVQPLCSLCLCGYRECKTQQPQRHREHRGCTEKR